MNKDKKYYVVYDVLHKSERCSEVIKAKSVNNAWREFRLGHPYTFKGYTKMQMPFGFYNERQGIWQKNIYVKGIDKPFLMSVWISEIEVKDTSK